MKVISLLLLLFITLNLVFATKPTPPPIPNQEKDIFEYVTEFEGYLLAAGMQADWKAKKRPHWRAECVKGTKVADAIVLLQELSDSMLAASIKTDWDKEKWVNSCKSASSVKEVAELLVQFQSAILPIALNPSWENRKAKWIIECQKAPLEGGSALEGFMHEK